MQNLILILSTLFLSFPPSEQSNCRVLKKSISANYAGECKGRLAHGHGIAQGEDTYEGKFKKGYPHGEGKYIWADGSYYVGEFQKGLRHGEGTMHSIDSATQSLVAGNLALWKDDKYIMDVMEEEYSIIIQRNIVSLDFKKMNESKNFVEIYLRNIVTLGEYEMITSSGTNVRQGKRLLIENCEFPLNVRLEYETRNKVSEVIKVFAHFEIESEGRWAVTLTSM